MTYTLSNMMTDMYMSLGQLNVSTVTSGSTVALADTKQATLHGDDSWKNGAVIVIRDGTTAGAAPEGEFSLCTAYTDSTGSFATVWTAAPAATDTYAFVNDFYPLYPMIEVCNMALQELGDIILVDTSLTTAANQTEYALPVTCKGSRPLSVAIQGVTTDANDNRYTTVFGWDYIPAAPGSTGNLVFDVQPITGKSIKIVYSGRHPKLSIYSSVISETIHPSLAAAAATEMALRWQNSRLQGGDDFLLQRWNDAKQSLVTAKALFPVWKPKRQAKLLVINSSYWDADSIADPAPGVRT